jgi:hypothetical protein
VTGHVSGLPLEELLPTLMSGGAAWLVLRVTSLGARLRSSRDAERGSATNEMEER